jgi:spore coat polysaccharide biosynthesis protein SpsF
MMNTVAIVQARVSSTRLPAKILLDLAGKPALERCVDCIRRMASIQKIVIATTIQPKDEMVVWAAKKLGVEVWRGSEQDTLSRYYDAASNHAADIVVRFTSDCPLLDPTISDNVVETFLDKMETSDPWDYASNHFDRKLPRGLDTEVMTFKALERAHHEAKSSAEREHVTPYLYQHPELFRCGSVLPELSQDYSHLRWTLDTLDDYHFLNSVFHHLGDAASNTTMDRVLEILRARPELANINQHIVQKTI